MIETATTADMMELFGLSDRSVREHAKSGIFVRAGHGQYDVKASIRAYVTHMRNAAAGRPATNEELRAEKIRLTAAQADMAEMAKAERAETMVDVKEFEDRWGDEVTLLRQALLALAAKIGTAHPQLTAHDVLSIDRTIRDELERIAAEADERLAEADAATGKVRKSARRTSGR